MPPTKDELEQENAALRERVAELEEQTALGASPAEVDGRGRAPRPERPGYLSAGEKDDLEVHGVTTSPFTGETLTATREGVEPRTPEAKRNDKRETARLDAADKAEGRPARRPGQPDTAPATSAAAGD